VSYRQESVIEAVAIVTQAVSTTESVVSSSHSIDQFDHWDMTCLVFATGRLMELCNRHSVITISASLFESVLPYCIAYNAPFWYSTGNISTVSMRQVVHNLYRPCLFEIGSLPLRSVFLPHILCTFFSAQALPIWCSSFPDSCFPPSSDFIILSFKSYFDLQFANISLHLCEMSQIEPNDIRSQSYVPTMHILSANTRRPSSICQLLLNWVFLYSLDLWVGRGSGWRSYNVCLILFNHLITLLLLYTSFTVRNQSPCPLVP